MRIDRCVRVGALGLLTALLCTFMPGSAGAKAPRPGRDPLHDDQHAGLGPARRAGADVREADRSHVKTISVGTGQALALAARGEADVTLAHAPGLEKKYVEEGKMSNRRLVMYNDFVIIGPPDDPAKIKGLSEGGGRAQAHRGEPGALRLARRQVRHPRAGAGAVEAGRHRAEGRLVHRIGPGHGPDPRHRQRPPRLHPDRSRRRSSRSRSGWTCRSSWRRTGRC